MKETTKKIREQAIAEIEPLIEQLAKEGLRGKELVAKAESAIRSRINVLYRKKRDQPTHAGEIVNNVLADALGITRKGADSKAEVILYELFIKNEIPFKFQYSIGRYTVDFLINGTLVVELDGPGHNQKRDEIRDAYLRRMGYRVLRVPIWVLAINPQAVIEEIREHIK